MENAIKRIKTEWESRGIVADDSFGRLFPEKKAKRIYERLNYWRTKSNDQETGELDIAFKNRDAPKVSAILKEFIPFSQEFLVMAAERFSEQAVGK